jgi:hypothetical protein
MNLAIQMRRNRGRFLLIGRSASPTGLLIFRGMGLLNIYSWPRFAVDKDKVAAGVNPAARPRE